MCPFFQSSVVLGQFRKILLPKFIFILGGQYTATELKTEIEIKEDKNISWQLTKEFQVFRST